MLDTVNQSSPALTGKWAILAKDHPTVVRRLAKELNSHGWQSGKAFYVRIPGVERTKWTGARIRSGKLEICMCNEGWTEVSALADFDDGNGNSIYASRTK